MPRELGKKRIHPLGKVVAGEDKGDPFFSDGPPDNRAVMNCKSSLSCRDGRCGEVRIMVVGLWCAGERKRQGKRPGPVLARHGVHWTDFLTWEHTRRAKTAAAANLPENGFDHG